MTRTERRTIVALAALVWMPAQLVHSLNRTCWMHLAALATSLLSYTMPSLWACELECKTGRSDAIFARTYVHGIHARHEAGTRCMSRGRTATPSISWRCLNWMTRLSTLVSATRRCGD